MRIIDHPYVVKLIEVIATQQKIMLVMEFVDGGDLFDLIKTEKDGKMAEKKARMYFQQMILNLIQQYFLTIFLLIKRKIVLKYLILVYQHFLNQKMSLLIMHVEQLII